MKGSRGGSWGDGVSPRPPGVEGKCPWSSAEWWEGHRLACPKFQPPSGVSASFAEAGGVMGAGRRAGESVSGLGQAGGRPSKGLRASARGVKWEGHRLACPKLQPRSGVSGEHGRLGRADAKRGLFIAEVAERVSFTVGTTVLPSEARGDGSGALCWWDPFQAWVKPEVDPPRASAPPRGGETSPVWSLFSRPGG